VPNVTKILVSDGVNPLYWRQKWQKAKQRQIYIGVGGGAFFGGMNRADPEPLPLTLSPAILLIVHQQGHIFCKPLDGLARLLHAPSEREIATDRGKEKSLYTCRPHA
jgi:hypothetical protein